MPHINMRSALLIMFSHGTLGALGSSRFELLQLLDHLGPPTVVDSTLPSILSFMESDASQMHMTTSGGGNSEPRRRVTSHPPCECPDDSDALSQGCLARRLKIVQDAMKAEEGQDGLELGRQEVRRGYSTLTEQVDAAGKLTATMYANVFDGVGSRPSFLGVTQAQINAIKDVTTAMTGCINSHWVQSFALSKLTDDELTKLNTKVGLVVESITQWFNKIQIFEEMVNFNNTRLTLNYVNKFLDSASADMNDAMSGAHQYLDLLDKSLGKSDDSTTALADSLVASADTLNGHIADFAEKLTALVAQTKASLDEDTLPRLVASFKTSGDKLIDQLSKTTQIKVTQVSNTSSTAAVKQEKQFMDTILPAARKDALTALSNVTNMEKAYRESAQALKTSTEDAITAIVEGHVKNVTASIAESRKGLDAYASRDAAVSGLLKQVGPDSDRALTRIKTSIAQLESSIKQQMDSILNSLTAQTHADLQAAVTMSSTATDAMVSLTREQIDSMTKKLLDTMQAFAENSTSAVSKAKSASNGIAVAYRSFVNKFADKSDEVNGLSRTKLGPVLDIALTRLAPGVTKTAQLSTTGIRKAVADRVGNITGQVTLLSLKAKVNSTALATAAQEKVAAYAKSVMASSMTAKAKANLIHAAVKQLAQRRASLAAAKQRVRTESANRVAQSATLMASAQQSMADVFGKADRSLQTGPPRTAPVGLSDPLTRAADGVAGLASQLDDGVNQNMRDGQQAADTVKAARAAANASARAARRLARERAQAVDDGTTDGGRGVQSAQAQTAHMAIDSAMDAMSKLKIARYAGSLKINRLSETDLEAVRSVAARLDVLMSTIGAFLKSQMPHVLDATSQSTVIGNKFGLLFDGTVDPLDALRSSLNISEWSSKWLDLNRTVVDAKADASVLLSTLLTQALKDMDAVPSKIQSTVIALLNAFSKQQTDLKDQLTLASGEADRLVANTSDTSAEGLAAVNKIAAIQSGLKNMINGQTVPPLANFPDTTNVSGRVTTLVGAQGALSTQASGAAAGSSSLAGQLVTSAEADLDSVLANISSEALHSQSVDSFKATLKTQAVAKSANMNQQVATDLKGTMNDYLANVELETQARNSRPEIIYNDVIRNKAQVSATIARMIASVSNSSAAIGEQSSTDSQLMAAMLGVNVANVARVFEYYRKSFSSGQQLAQGKGYFDQALTATVESALRKLHELEWNLSMADDQVTAQLGEAGRGILSLQADYGDIGNKTAELRADVTNWRANIKKDVLALTTRVSNITTTTPSVHAAIADVIARIVTTIENAAGSLFPAANATALASKLDAVELKFNNYTAR